MRAVVLFLLETAGFLMVGAALLRAWMNQVKVNMSAQPGRFVMALTHWLVAPLRKLLPRSLVQSRVDWGSLAAAVVLALGYGVLWVLLQAALLPAAVSSSILLVIPELALRLLVRVMLQGLMVMLLVYAVLSWVQPGSPLMGMLDRLCSPILKPVRRVLPLIGGVDLSVLVLIVLLQVGLILLG
ncbi:YggT family protein [Hydrogenophaga sp. RWCD_12]|uniref:YggT family protein n=1 Tax=Hydrogenophaga sp. RWCD_12 TaxID=3391190 RepID=UPI0039852555